MRVREVGLDPGLYLSQTAISVALDDKRNPIRTIKYQSFLFTLLKTPIGGLLYFEIRLVMGNQTKLNQKANKKLKQLFLEKEVTRCESCGSDYHLTFAHRHKRDWYKGKPEHLLYSFDQVLLLCLKCHMDIEYSKEKTARLFNHLRDEI